MASINGISIKNFKTVISHEGCEIYQGDVWYNGRKLGFWSQDYNGCISDNFDFNKRELDAEVEKYKASDRVSDELRRVTRLESLLSDLVNVMYSEKCYKKAVKVGYNTYVEFTDGYHCEGFFTMDTSKEKILNDDYYKKFEKKCKGYFFTNKEMEISIYTSPDNFKIAV